MPLRTSYGSSLTVYATHPEMSVFEFPTPPFKPSIWLIHGDDPYVVGSARDFDDGVNLVDEGIFNGFQECLAERRVMLIYR